MKCYQIMRIVNHEFLYLFIDTSWIYLFFHLKNVLLLSFNGFECSFCLELYIYVCNLKQAVYFRVYPVWSVM